MPLVPTSVAGQCRVAARPHKRQGGVDTLACAQILFVIKEPDVFRHGAGDNPKSAATFVVFGKAEIEDLSAQATSAAVEQFKNPGAGLEVCMLCFASPPLFRPLLFPDPV